MEKKFKKVDSSNKLTKDFNSATLNSLNDDCLVHIFEYLPIRDRVRLQGVNKRWMAVSQASWNRFKKLDFTRELWGFSQDKYIDIDVALAQILAQCGKYLTHIKMDLQHDEYHPIVSKDIDFNLFKFTPKLKSVDFGLKLITAENMQIFTEHCKHIEEIGFSYLIDQVIKETVFRTYKNLRIIKFHRCDITGQCLKTISMEHIEELEFSFCPTLTYSIAFDFISKCQKLTKLSLHYFFVRSDIPISMLPKRLQDLDISRNNPGVDDNFIKILCESCPNLNSLNISDNFFVTDVGLSYIADLHNLEHLYVNHLARITGQYFVNLPRLKTLSCVHTRVALKYLRSLLEASDELKLLDLWYCREVGKKFVTFAIKHLKTRRHDIILTIILRHMDPRSVKLSRNLKLVLGKD